MLLLLTLTTGCAPCRGEDCIAAAQATSGTEALALWDLGCKDGVTMACGEAARLREFGEGVPLDHAAAFAGYEAMCEDKVLRGCMAMGNMLRKGTAPGGADPARARAIIQGACELQDGLSCAALAQIALTEGDLPGALKAAEQSCKLEEPFGCGLAQNLKSRPSQTLDPKACEGDEPSRCLEYAMLLLEGLAGPEEQTRGRALVQELCEVKQQASACVNLGMTLSQGLGGPADPQGAAALYKRACEAGEPMGCYNEALLRHEGRGLPQDTPAAMTQMLGACDAGFAPACVMGGNFLQDAGQLDEALRRWDQACTQNQALGCTNYALELLDPSPGRTADPSRGLALLKQACDAQEPFGCAALGRELVEGRYTLAEPERGAALLRQGCEQGSHAACTYLGLR